MFQQQNTFDEWRKLIFWFSYYNSQYSAKKSILEDPQWWNSDYRRA